jgi:hypothetical protein
MLRRRLPKHFITYRLLRVLALRRHGIRAIARLIVMAQSEFRHTAVSGSDLLRGVVLDSVLSGGLVSILINALLHLFAIILSEQGA